jgi:hypothetical protein
VSTNTNGGSSGGGAEDGTRPEDSDLSEQYVDLAQLANQRLNDLANGLVAAVRAQPMAAAAVIAGGVGVGIGLAMAGRGRPRQEALGEALAGQAETVEKQARRARQGGKRLGRAGDYGDLIPLAMRLLENPVVRGLIIQAVTRSVSKRFR